MIRVTVMKCGECECVRVSMCVSVCLHVSVCASLHQCVSVCVSVCVNVSQCMCQCESLCVNVCINVCQCVLMGVSMHQCVSMFVSVGVSGCWAKQKHITFWSFTNSHFYFNHPSTQNLFIGLVPLFMLNCIVFGNIAYANSDCLNNTTICAWVIEPLLRAAKLKHYLKMTPLVYTLLLTPCNIINFYHFLYGTIAPWFIKLSGLRLGDYRHCMTGF